MVFGKNSFYIKPIANQVKEMTMTKKNKIVGLVILNIPVLVGFVLYFSSVFALVPENKTMNLGFVGVIIFLWLLLNVALYPMM
ncbi:hypothetical protein ACFLZP_04680 [Patescibacteria group bacterium]